MFKNWKRKAAAFLAALTVMSVGAVAAHAEPNTYTSESGTTYTRTTEVLHGETKAGVKGGVYSTDSFDGSTVEGVGVTGYATAKGSVYSVGGTIEKGKSKVSAEVDVLSGKAEASITAGAWKSTNAAGKTETGYGVKANLEAGGSVASGDVKGSYGSKDYNVKANANAEALAAGAKATGEVGIVNGNVVVSGKASAEADLVKVGGSVGGTVGGVEMSVGASAKVGVGAHAKVGYKDGKVSCDFGAALGVGMDLKFDVDVGAAASKVADGTVYAAGKVADGTVYAAGKVADGAVYAASKVADAAESVWNAIKFW